MLFCLFQVLYKRQGQIVGVFAGILIMLTTLGVLALANRNATATLLNAQQAARELTDLQINLQMAQQQLEQAAQRQMIAENEAARAQDEADALREETAELAGLIEDLGSQVGELEAQAEQLRSQNSLLQGENDALSSRNDELAVDNSRLLDQNTLLGEVNENLRQQFEESNSRVFELEGNLQVLELAMEDSSRRLVELQGEFEQIAAGELAFRTDDLIYSGRIQAVDLASAREELAAFVRAANEVTAQRGAGTIQLSTAQFDSLVNMVAQSDDELVIALISPRNQLRSAAVEVSIEAWENSQVLAGGQLLSSRVLHLGTADQPAAQGDIRTGLGELVRSTRSRLTRAGFFSQEAPQFADSEDAFMAQLERLDGRVVVGVLTRAPVFRGGPAAL